jgi:hydroxymethylbilane synthase
MTAAQTPLRLGTRRSPLALAQSRWVADRLASSTGRRVELVEVCTRGDLSDQHVAQIGGTGVFAAALRLELSAGRVDLAVHSLKDLPTAAEPGLVVAAVPARADVRDVLVARDGLTLGELPPGACLGTGSPRRTSQLLALGLGHTVRPVRGNVGTRIDLVRQGAVDGVLLARAGLLRLGRADEATEVLDPLQMLPAPGQGALAVECRADHVELISLLAGLEDADARASVTAERALLAALEAGCSAPIGALAEVVESLDRAGAVVLELSLRAVVASADGAVVLRRSAVGPFDRPQALGRALAGDLLADGAVDLTRPTEPPRAPALVPAPFRGPSPERPPGPDDFDLSAAQSSPERAS